MHAACNPSKNLRRGVHLCNDARHVIPLCLGGGGASTASMRFHSVCLCARLAPSHTPATPVPRSLPHFFSRLPHTRNCLPHTQRTRHDQAPHPHLCLYVTRAERWLVRTLCDVTHVTNATSDPADHLIVCVFKRGNRRSDWLSTATTSHAVLSTRGVQQGRGAALVSNPQQGTLCCCHSARAGGGCWLLWWWWWWWWW